MIKIRRSTPITACKKLDGNDIYPLINFSWIMVAFAFVFVFLLSEVSADPRIYRSKYTLSLKGVHFFNGRIRIFRRFIRYQEKKKYKSQRPRGRNAKSERGIRKIR